jgi:galactokinase/mevalonate kinase-like predicted kinase
LPAYAPSGKILTPVPVFRWARGQRLGQNLLSLQLPLYEEILGGAPASFHTLIASGDVFIRCRRPLPEAPEVDVACFGLWTDSLLASRHGVFLSERERPEALDFMLQKPSLGELAKLARTHLFLMDAGIWLLSDRAVRVLMKRAHEADGVTPKAYDLYAEFGTALGNRPGRIDGEVNGLSTAILPLPDGEFYHYGSGRELISSTLAVQNLVHDQRSIMQRAVKPHPAMFVQNARVDVPLTAGNSEVWIENSCIGSGWKLSDRHILTGIPPNAWEVEVPGGICIDVVPVGAKEWALRPYGFSDVFRGATRAGDTFFMEKPLGQWAGERGVEIPETPDIQDALLFPVCATMEAMGLLLRWMIAEPGLEEGKELWRQARKMSANALLAQTNLRRLTAQRNVFRAESWPLLAANHEKSIFYQLDLEDAAGEFAAWRIPSPSAPAPGGEGKQMQHAMFCARRLQIDGEEFAEEEQRAFTLLKEEITGRMAHQRVHPRLHVHHDQIVWARSPVRIDLAGGWTDTPPYCLYAGGRVANLAIELNGQPPLQVYIKPSQGYAVTLRSIDLGAMEVISTREELRDYAGGGGAFSIPKAALALAGFLPEYSLERYDSLKEQLRAFGSGMEITLLSAIPAGSGLGVSSILGATILGALSDFCGLGWDATETGNRALVLEQLLSAGGGWQDAFGGILHGVKLLQTDRGCLQSPFVRWLPDHLFTDAHYRPCHLLYYTGITRRAKVILGEIVRSMFLNHGKTLQLLAEMKAHAQDMYEAIQCGDFTAYGLGVGKTWGQNQALDAGTNPPAVEAMIALIRDYALGYKLPGAGGGGYLYLVAKDPEAAERIRRKLSEAAPRANARFVEMQLCKKGLQVSRS